MPPSQKQSRIGSTNEGIGQQFASDNWAGVCPEAWAALAEANQGYGTLRA